MITNKQECLVLELPYDILPRDVFCCVNCLHTRISNEARKEYWRMHKSDSRFLGVCVRS